MPGAHETGNRYLSSSIVNSPIVSSSSLRDRFGLPQDSPKPCVPLVLLGLLSGDTVLFERGGGSGSRLPHVSVGDAALVTFTSVDAAELF